MTRLVLAIAAVALLGGCEIWPAPVEPGTPDRQNQAAANRMDAAQRCGAAGVIQRPGSDGTSPGDYYCAGR